MRLCPVPCFYAADPKKAAAISDEQSRTTHASDIAAEACQFLSLLLSGILKQNYQQAKQANLESDWSYPLLSAVDHSFSGYSDAGISSGGYVLDTLQAALWSVENGIFQRNRFACSQFRRTTQIQQQPWRDKLREQCTGFLSIDHDLYLAKERQLYVTSQFLSSP